MSGKSTDVELDAVVAPLGRIAAGADRAVKKWADDNPKLADHLFFWLLHATAPTTPDEEGLSTGHRMFRRVMPANWWDLSVPMVERARAQMRDTGLCLVWVPRSDVLSKLAVAKNKLDRDALLIEREAEILDDIDEALNAADHQRVKHLSAAAREATLSYRGGAAGPAQAYTVPILGTILEAHFGHRRFDKARDALQIDDPGSVDVRAYRTASIEWMIRTAVLRSQDAPEGFNRHLSAHRADPEQFTRPHALAALMLVAGALRELHEFYVGRDRGLPMVPTVLSGAHEAALEPRAARA